VAFADDMEEEMYEEMEAGEHMREDGQRRPPRPMLFRQGDNEEHPTSMFGETQDEEMVDDEGRRKRPKQPVMMRHQGNDARQLASHIKRIQKQLENIHEQMERLKEKAEELKEKLEEAKDSTEDSWKMDDDRYEGEEEREMRRDEAMGKQQAPKTRRRWQPNRDEDGEMGDRKEIKEKKKASPRKRFWRKGKDDGTVESNLDANMFGDQVSDQEEARQRSATAKEKMKRFWKIFQRRR
jgi:predicted RNase H-like nuclease (RuvC/YqgF family)